MLMKTHNLNYLGKNSKKFKKLRSFFGATKLALVFGSCKGGYKLLVGFLGNLKNNNKPLACDVYVIYDWSIMFKDYI